MLSPYLPSNERGMGEGWILRSPEPTSRGSAGEALWEHSEPEAGSHLFMQLNFQLWDWALRYYRAREREGQHPDWLAGFVARMDERLGLR
jgi:hypothetical protein